MEIIFKLNSVAELASLREWLNSHVAQEAQTNVVVNAPIEGLYLTVRSENCLKAERIETIGQLVTWSKGALLKTPNLGNKSLSEIEDALKRLNLELAHISKATCETAAGDEA